MRVPATISLDQRPLHCVARIAMAAAGQHGGENKARAPCRVPALEYHHHIDRAAVSRHRQRRTATPIMPMSANCCQCLGVVTPPPTWRCASRTSKLYPWRSSGRRLSARSVCSSVMFEVHGAYKPQYHLGDDVFLNFVGAAEDRQLAEIEVMPGERRGPSSAVTARAACPPSQIGSVERQRIRADRLASSASELLLDFGALHLQHASFRAAARRCRPTARAARVISQRHQFDFQFGDAPRKRGSSSSGLPFSSAWRRCLEVVAARASTRRCRRYWCVRGRAGTWRKSSPCSLRRPGFPAGTLTLSKNTSLTSCSPSSIMIGRTAMPGVFMSISKKLMPSCFLAVGVGAHQAEDHVGELASVVQVFWPLTT